MATPRRATRVSIVAVVGVLTALLLPATSGSATPTRTISDVQREVDALSAQVDVATEQYDQARIALSTAARRTKAAEDRVKRAEAGIAAQRSTMARIATAAYRNGGTDQILTLVATSNPQDFLGQAAALDLISSHDAAALQSMRVAQLGYTQAQNEARQTLSAQRKVAATLRAHKAAIESLLAKQQDLLSSLKAEERQRLAAIEAARAQQVASSAASRGVAATYNGPATGRAEVAVRFAYAQLGKPYQWGASGPSSYDCSGLTMSAWGAAGVSLPHSSAAQYNSGPHVSQSDVQPGDLLFYGSPIHHVMIYVGGGRAIDAPHTGSYVQFEYPWRSDYVGAVRP